MSQYDIDKAYVSPYDKFLFEFDATHAKSASQLNEIRKNDRIAQLRDNVQEPTDGDAIWTDF